MNKASVAFPIGVWFFGPIQKKHSKEVCVCSWGLSACLIVCDSNRLHPKWCRIYSQPWTVTVSWRRILAAKKTGSTASVFPFCCLNHRWKCGCKPCLWHALCIPAAHPKHLMVTGSYINLIKKKTKQKQMPLNIIQSVIVFPTKYICCFSLVAC